MMSLNKIQLIGNLTRNPEIKETEHGHKIVWFTVATDFKVGEKEETEFHNVIAWDNLAEICIGFLEKGDRVYIEGRIHTYIREDEDARYYNVEVIADKMLLLAKSGKKNQTEGNGKGEEEGSEKVKTESADKNNEIETTEKQSNPKKSLKE